ncbi:MAG: HAMP domain-containing histidine kinase [Lachnospiraceae bacterium]|nr:HAMP domain-containing histidine kinase [Lachnospiraceae bacterium]
MDTKSKKSKLIVSFAIFFLGMTLFIDSLLSVAGLAVSSKGTAFDWHKSYQETAAFRSYIASYLEAFLGVATGGKGWRLYGTADRYEGDAIVQEEAVAGTGWEDWTGFLEDQTWETWEAWEAWEAEVSGEAVSSVPQTEASGMDLRDNYRDGTWSGTSEKDFMKDIAQNKNLRYAIVYQNKLLYTNIDNLEGQVGTPWDNLNFEEQLSPDEYNFTLWFNKDNAGKTRIFRDGAELEIYGNGMYSSDRQWFVPGYTNFNVDEAAGDAVIFLAAAREPKLYVSGNYSEYGTSQYGGRLYSIHENLLELQAQFKKSCILLGISLLLLALSFFFRKERRLMRASIGRLTGKLWLEFKVLLFLVLPLLILLFLVLPLFLFLGNTEGVLFFQAHLLGIVCFWLLYLGALDRNANKEAQKKPLITGLRSRDLQRPLQKRMIQRYRLSMAIWLMAPLLFLLALFLPMGEYLNWMLGVHPLPFLFLVLAYLGLSAASIRYLKKNRRLAEDLGAFFHQVDTVREGDLTEPLVLPADSELREAAERLNEIQHGLETALQEKLRSEQMKVELVTNVSHDIKTPLTSIISYVELLKQEGELPDHVREFIQILGEKSERLKVIVQDVFEVSKAASGQLPIEPETLDLKKLLQQTLADMDTPITQSGLFMKLSFPEEPVTVFADGKRLYRVFQNLIQNALSYSLEGSRIFLTLKTEGAVALVSIRNTSARELNKTTDFSERFVRGDASRSDGGSGLGLSIARSFTEACGGTLRISIDADLFTVTVAFPTCQVPPVQ